MWQTVLWQEQRGYRVKIEVGKKYSTKNGKIFFCEKDLNQIDGWPYQAMSFGGLVRDVDGALDRVAYYTESGRYSTDHISDYDISHII